MSTVLVTGATDGLGRALATRLASEGATVIAHARSEERGREALAELLDGSGEVQLVDRRPGVAERRARAGRPGARPPRRARQQRRHRLRGRARGERRRLRAAFRRQLPGGLPARLAAARAPGARRRRRGSSTSPPPASRRSTSTTSCSRTATTAPARTARASSRRSCTPSTSPRRSSARASPPRRCTPRPTWRRRWSPRPGSRRRAPCEEGLEATWRLVADPTLDGVSGVYFNGTSEARADAQAYDLDARRRLRELSQRLVTVGRS